VTNALFGLFAMSLIASVAGMFVLQVRNFERKFIAVSGAAMLAIAVFWIGPDLTESAGLAHAVLGVAVAFTALYAFDRYVHPICPCCAQATGSACRSSYTTLLPLATAICIHNVFDGWIASAAGDVGPVPGSGIMTGLLVHKIPEALLFGMMLRAASRNIQTALMSAAITGSTILLGGVARDRLQFLLGERIISISLAAACGSFLLFGFKLLWRR
jgi:zinc transporter ZupT